MRLSSVNGFRALCGLALSLALSACGSDGSDPKDTPLQGTWELACSVVKGSEGSVAERWSFDGRTFVASFTFHGRPGCAKDDRIATYDGSGTFSQYGRLLDIQPTKFSFTPYGANGRLTADMNCPGVEATDGKAIDLRKCKAFKSGYGKTHQLAEIKDGKLYFGAVSPKADGRTPETRPKELDLSRPFVRK